MMSGLTRGVWRQSIQEQVIEKISGSAREGATMRSQSHPLIPISVIFRANLTLRFLT